jgi:hypothetical protein
MGNPNWIAAIALLTPLAAGALQPLVTDDTGTVGAQVWQIETGFEQIPRQGDAGRQRQWSTTLTRGWSESLDLYLGMPYTRFDDFGAGWNDVAPGLKWRFAQQGPLSLALKPEITLPTGDWRRGLGAGHAGADVTLIAQWNSAPLTLLGNATLIRLPNRQGDRQSLWRFAGAALYRVTEQFSLASEIVIARNPARDATGMPPAFTSAAAIYSPAPWLDLDIGYRHGLNRQADNHSITAGLTARW